jgi:chemotaxis family two-component system sensor kinase Cph1
MTQVTSELPPLDLSSCDKEPIRFPGSIQPHGFLLCLSSRLSVLQASDNLAERTGVAAADALGQPLAAVDFMDNMSRVFPELLRFARAGGVAVVVDERVISHGDAPSHQQIGELVASLNVRKHDDLFHTDSLAAAYAPAAAFTRNASGLLAMPISRIHRHYLLWFRPEIVHTIDWAGNPHAKDGAADPRAQLTPRTSFATWRETIHGTSAPWHNGEIELALEFRTALLGIALERAEQMAELAAELGRSNKELEAFSYSVSHDLRAPLRHIVGFSDLLMSSGGDSDSATRLRFLANIKDAARLAGKLVDDLLSFSQMGRAALRPVEVDMRDLVAGCIEKLAGELAGRTVQWQIGDLPAVRADPSFLQLAVLNLLSNAVKFTAGKAPAIIRIDATAARSTTTACSGWRRAKASRCDDSLAPRSTPASAMSMRVRALSLTPPSSLISCRLPPMICSTLLKSWATPPVSWPIASIFCAWCRADGLAASSRWLRRSETNAASRCWRATKASL